MTVPLTETPERRVCVFSQRAIRRDVSRCSGYEFEDLVLDLEGADLVVPTRPESREFMYRARRFLSKRTAGFSWCPSGTQRQRLTGKYDLFGCFLQKPVELLSIDAAMDWRTRSEMAFCVLEELWHTTMDDFTPLVRSLSQFDLIACAFESSCERLAKLTGRPVVHLPGAADLLAFEPESLQVPRPIDVYYMGRRRPELHAVLKPALAARGGFYLYDSAAGAPIAQDHVTHRELLASLVGRSKLFMVDYGKIGHADQSTGQVIWGPRHVEGMAGGALQVGYAPETEDYAAHFDWPEAIERLDPDPDRAVSQILALLDDPEQIAHRRRINHLQASTRHDWLNRWTLITEHFGLAPTQASQQRAQRLEAYRARYES